MSVKWKSKSGNLSDCKMPGFYGHDAAVQKLLGERRVKVRRGPLVSHLDRLEMQGFMRQRQWGTLQLELAMITMKTIRCVYVHKCVCELECLLSLMIMRQTETGSQASSQCHLKRTAAWASRLCVWVCVGVHLWQIGHQKSPLDTVLMKLIKKGRKWKHFVPCDNKMSFCFLATIGCFLMRDYCWGMSLCE